MKEKHEEGKEKILCVVVNNSSGQIALGADGRFGGGGGLWYIGGGLERWKDCQGGSVIAEDHGRLNLHALRSETFRWIWVLRLIR